MADGDRNCYYTYLKKSGRKDSIDDERLTELASQESTIEERYMKQDE